jgi:hypothetical protein
VAANNTTIVIENFMPGAMAGYPVPQCGHLAAISATAPPHSLHLVSAMFRLPNVIIHLDAKLDVDLRHRRSGVLPGEGVAEHPDVFPDQFLSPDTCRIGHVQVSSSGFTLQHFQHINCGDFGTLRRIATRYEKQAENYLAMLHIGSILLWLWFANTP